MSASIEFMQYNDDAKHNRPTNGRGKILLPVSILKNLVTMPCWSMFLTDFEK